MDLKRICSDASEIVRETGSFIRGERLKFNAASIEIKGKHNFVTHVDKESEIRLIHGLQKLVPQAGFIAEEGTNTRREKKLNWVIDPLDGTTNFIHGCPPYAISVALMDDDKVILGIVYEIALSEMFYSCYGSPAFMDGKEITVSLNAGIADSLIATGFPYTNFERMEPFMQTLKYFFTNSHGVRRIGSAATDLAYVACGRYDAFYEYNLNAWDVAAGSFLVQQAGGKVSDFKGGDNFIFGNEVVAANENVFQEFRNAIGNIMNV